MSFDRLAPHYRWMEAVLAGGLLQRCRTRWLGEVRDSRRALLVGEGHGRMLEACAAGLPDCEFMVLDQSEEMLVTARRRWSQIGGRQKVSFQPADLRAWRADGPVFDLVVTNFFLDCFTPEELPRVIANISAALTPQGRWLLADFSVPPAGWRRLRAQLVLALAYGFFQQATGISASRVTPPDVEFRRAGFELRKREEFNHGLLHADLWARAA